MAAMTGEEIRDATATAVAEVLEEMGVEEPRPAIERGVAATEGGDEDDDDDAEPSVENLDRINADPRLRATYRSLLRKSREATEKLEAKGRDNAQARAALQALRADPRTAARALAHAVGGRVEFPPEPTRAERARAKLAPMIGEEAAAALAAPLVEIAGHVVREEMAPVRGHIEQQLAEEDSRQLNDGLRTWAERAQAEGREFDAGIEKEMAALVPKLRPSAETSLPEFLDFLHATVMRRRGALRGGPGEGRARRSGRDDDESASGTTIRAGMDPKRAVALAVREAEREYAAGRGRRR